MYVQTGKHLMAWSLLHPIGIKYVVSAWKSGASSSTHPEWMFNPLTLFGLAMLWLEFIPPTDGSIDRCKSQRRALRALGKHRSKYPDGEKYPYPTGDDYNDWSDYWENIRADSVGFNDHTQFKILNVASTELNEFDTLQRLLDTYAGNLIASGYSIPELFHRVEGVIDSTNKSKIDDIEKLSGLLGHLKRRPQTSYITMTKILTSEDPLTKRSLRRIASIKLENAGEWHDGKCGFCLISNTPYAISKFDSTHSATAVMEHRYKLNQLLKVKVGKLPHLNLKLSDSTTVITGKNNDVNWTYSPDNTDMTKWLGKKFQTQEYKAYHLALSLLNDSPEESIRIMCDAFDRQYGAGWPEVVGKNYRSVLRYQLRKDLIAYLNESYIRWAREPEQPSWIKLFPPKDDEYLDFSRVTKAASEDGQYGDLLLSKRAKMMIDARVLNRKGNKLQKYLIVTFLAVIGIIIAILAHYTSGFPLLAKIVVFPIAVIVTWFSVEYVFAKVC